MVGAGVESVQSTTGRVRLVSRELVPGARPRTKDEILRVLLDRFRSSGFDGASLAELSTATGLGKSSLYHHFPAGKTDMARQVLGYLERQLRTALFEPLAADLSPQDKLGRMLAAVWTFYEGGRRACLLERLAASIDRQAFHRPLARVFSRWISAVEGLCREVGLPPRVARERAEALVTSIEGALVVAAGLGEPAVFDRTLRRLARSTLARGGR